MLRKIMVSLGLAAVGLLTVAGPASAAGTGSVTPNPVPIPAIDPTVGFTQKVNAVTVEWSNMAVGQPVYISICRRAQSDPLFGSYGASCSNLSEVIASPAFQVNGAGSKTFDVFRGLNPDDPDTDWGCYAAGDVAPAGVQKLTTCFIRLASGSEADTTFAHTIPFTITNDTSTTTTTTIPGNPDPVVSEASSVVLLPVVAGGIALLAVGVQRRRRMAQS